MGELLFLAMISTHQHKYTTIVLSTDVDKDQRGMRSDQNTTPS